MLMVTDDGNVDIAGCGCRRWSGVGGKGYRRRGGEGGHRCGRRRCSPAVWVKAVDSVGEVGCRVVKRMKMN